MSGLGVGSAYEGRRGLEERCQDADHMIRAAVEGGDFEWAMQVGCSVLDGISAQSHPGFLPVYTGQSRPEWSSASHSAFDVVYPGARPDGVEDSDSEGGYVSGSPDDVEESDSEGGYVSGSTDSTVWVPNL